MGLETLISTFLTIRLVVTHRTCTDAQLPFDRCMVPLETSDKQLEILFLVSSQVSRHDCSVTLVSGILSGQPLQRFLFVTGVFGRDVDVVDGNGLNYQQGSAANQGQVVVVRADRLMPVDRDFARQMKSEGMRARFERMTNKQGMGAGMRMGQPISCGILGRA